MTRFVFLGGLALTAYAAAPPRWTDITTEAGLAGFRNPQGSPRKDFVYESIGGGCGFLDYNQDGHLDIVLVRGKTSRRAPDTTPVIALYRNDGRGRFTDVTRETGIAAGGWGLGVTVADYDNDGWPDLFVTGLERNYLFRNQQGKRFTETARAAGVLGAGHWSTGAAFGDLDGDGNLDLYVASYVDVAAPLPERGSGASCMYKSAPVFCGPRGLKAAPHHVYRNRGDGTFTDVTRSAGFDRLAPPLYGFQPVIADFDGDGRQDIFVADDSEVNLLFRNLGGWKFAEEGIAAGVAVNGDGREQACMGVAVNDADGDGRLDILVTNFSEDTNTLYRQYEPGLFEDSSGKSGVGAPSWPFLGWGAAIADFDNDGWNDVVVANGHVYPEADQFRGGSAYRQRLLYHRNLGKGIFEEIGAAIPALARPATARGLAYGDFDNDGDLDLLINQQDDAPRLFRNDQEPGNHSLRIVLRGARSNRDGIGALVRVESSDGRVQHSARLGGDSYLSSSDPRPHFGFGAATAVEVGVRWPSGVEQTIKVKGSAQVVEV
ncbi:MAG: CRTAC1 family protein, partial [Bryobacteraceae bacterium]